MAEEAVDNAVRDQTFSSLRSNPQNNFCLDCEKKNPRWASVYLGIHLCIDCAGKHRQFGVMYSYIKSTNLDSWNRRQLSFMERGGNTRALEYFKKCGIITPANKHIDYKSAIVQKYKALLTEEVDNIVQGKTTTAPVPQQVKPVEVEKPELEKKESQVETNIQNKADQIQQPASKKNSKKDKKKVAAVRVDIDFENFEPDDGITQAEKEKMIKVSEPTPEVPKENGDQTSVSTENKIEAPKIDAPKEMEQTTAKETLQKLKQKDNIKAISSQTFKDNNISSTVLQQNLNKFSNSKGISSAAFFGQEEPKQDTMDKVKNILSSAGQKIYGKVSSYFNKS